MSASDTMLGFALMLAVLAAWFDLRTGHIPNAVTLTALALGSVLQLSLVCWSERAQLGALSAAFVAMASARVAFGIVVCAAVPYLLFLRNGMGGGDVKLLGALGGALGPVLGLEVQLYAFVLMLVFACAHLSYQGRLAQVLGNSAALFANPVLPAEKKRAPAPELFATFKFAPAVLAALLLVCLLRWGSA